MTGLERALAKLKKRNEEIAEAKKKKDREKDRIRKAKYRKALKEQKLKEEKLKEKQLRDEKIKAEKEREKAERKSTVKRKRKRTTVAHLKKVKAMQNKRYYDKKRAKLFEERKKEHDKYGRYKVVIMKDRKRITYIGKPVFLWRNDAFKAYEEAVEKNHSTVLCPIKIRQTPRGVAINKKLYRDTTYEILLLEKTDSDDKVVKLRNNDGKLIDNVIVDADYKIVSKKPWFVEESFNVYGHHPLKDRKDAHFILNNMLLKDVSHDNIKRVFVFYNKFVIQYDGDFDFVTCKSKREADRLYMLMEKCITKLKLNKYILFTDRLTSYMTLWFVNEMVKKTGWSREACARGD